jgi:DNA recombination protein RmuC
MIELLIDNYLKQMAILGSVAGLGIMWLIYRNRLLKISNNQLQLKLAVSKERIEHKDDRIEDKDCEIEKLNKTIQERENLNKNLQKDIESKKVFIAELNMKFEEEKKAAQEKMVLLEQAEKKMTDAFENLSNRILEEKSKKFTDQNKSSIGEVLNPLREQLGDFRKKIEDVYDKETKDRMSLYHEITNLKLLNEQMSKDAINLTNALKGDTKKQGDWGEVILERVLEDSGLKKDREYEVQSTYKDENGNFFRPDFVVHLPNKRDVIIDSKVSLIAYDRYYSTEKELDKAQALKEHIASIRKHINELKDKSYDELVGVNSLDIVLMFVAIEPALMLAFEHDRNLFQDAFKHRIFLVSPSTLTMNLQVIQNMWRYEYQNKNAQEIAKRAGDLYDKFTGFVEALEAIGDKLDKAQEHYQLAHNRLTDGKGNLISRLEAIRKLGNLKTKQLLPDELVNKVLAEHSDSNN